MENKRGMEFAINTIVVLILAVMVLVFLILFFNDAGKNFLNRTRGYQGYSNVDTIIDSCNFYADSGSLYNYCCERRNVQYFEYDEKREQEFSCLEVRNRFGEVSEVDCENIKC